jgi:hypothetical protein
MRSASLRIASLLLLVGAASCGVNNQPGDGEKIGQVVRLSKVGVMCKTWEGQLIRGGMSGGSGTIGMVPFDFTIESDAMAKDLEKYMREQTEVSITYNTEFIYGLCRSDSQGHFLTSVRPLAPPDTTTN